MNHGNCDTSTTVGMGNLYSYQINSVRFANRKFKMATNKSIYLIKMGLNARIRLILCVKISILEMLNYSLNVPG